jgi:hypothetical protein
MHYTKVESSIRFAGNGATFSGDRILDLQEQGKAKGCFAKPMIAWRNLSQQKKYK